MNDTLGKTSARVSLGLRLLAAVILAQTLFFKFTGAEESVYIFTQVGQEPWGRLGSGVAELIACVVLFTRFKALGAGLALGVMSGAIFFHLTKLGIEVKGDGGLLFALALITWAASGTVLWLHRRELPVVGSKF